MRKIFIYLIFSLIPLINNAGAPKITSGEVTGNDIFVEVNLADAGLAKDVFDLAIKGLMKLESEGKLNNPNIVTIADYSQLSNKKRLYVIDLKDRKLLFNTYVALGRNTGEEYAKSFSNVGKDLLKAALAFMLLKIRL